MYVKSFVDYKNYLVKGNKYEVLEEREGAYLIKDELGEKLILKEKECEIVSNNHEMVNHPSHYNKGKYEVIDVIEDWGLGFSLGNAIKYIARCEHKGNKKQDLEKALFYIKRELDREE